MQFIQPINSVINNDQFYPFATPLPYTEIKGEGDVVSLMLPDGSVQFYFIPTYRRDRRFSYSYNPATFNDHVPWPVGTEAWFIKRISSPALPSYMQEKIPHIEDPFLRSYYTSEGSEHLKSSQNPYYQKFHNDNVTSTTDIHYFYPNPRQTHLKHSASAQVDVPLKYNESCQTEDVYDSCSCSSKKNKHKVNMFRYNNMIDSSSAMSIDNQTQTSRKRQKNSKVRFKSAYKSKTHQYCSCNQTTMRNENDKADKMIFTYTDQATSCVDSDGQETQTLSAKDSQNSNKTEILKLNKSKSLMSCDSCCGTCYYCKTDCSSDYCE